LTVLQVLKWRFFSRQSAMIALGNNFYANSCALLTA